MREQVFPYKEKNSSKKEQVAEMFDNISHRYDFLNHLLSLGIDVLWRKRAIKLLQDDAPKTILDVATGTGDFAFEALKLNPEKIYGIDISKGMLAKGVEKVNAKALGDLIELKYGDSAEIPFDDNTFDAITVAFGVRNFENLENGLTEMKRVLKPEGKVVILEFSKPHVFPINKLYHFYFNFVLPKIGRMFSKDKAAYSYLPESVNAFPEGKNFETILERLGFTVLGRFPQFFGVSSIYYAKK